MRDGGWRKSPKANARRSRSCWRCASPAQNSTSLRKRFMRPPIAKANRNNYKQITTEGKLMKPIMLRLASIALLALLCAAAPVYAQNARLQIDHLDKLFPQAVETVDVRIDGALLLMASKFLRSDKEDEAAVKEIVRDLKGVYVKGVEFDKEGEYTESDVEAVRQQLAA